MTKISPASSSSLEDEDWGCFAAKKLYKWKKKSFLSSLCSNLNLALTLGFSNQPSPNKTPTNISFNKGSNPESLLFIPFTPESEYNLLAIILI